MPDPRFFDSHGPVSLGQLAKLTHADLDPVFAGVEVDTVAPLAKAGERSVTYGQRSYLEDIRLTRASACFIPRALAGELPTGCIALITDMPQAGFAAAASTLHSGKVHDTRQLLVHPSAHLEDGVIVNAGVVIGPGARIGRDTVIGPYTVIGPGVAIGRDCVIGAHVSIGFALIGDRVHLLSGARIGEAGFGVAASRSGPIDIPQLGRVIIQDRVTIGAGSCVDRGAWDDTVIGENSKLDNLVHIGHNVLLGRNCLLAAYTGISGSVVVGDGVAFGGRSGVADHITIGEGASIAAAAGVMKDVPAREVWGGAPARPLRRFMRETAWLARMAHAKPGRGGGDEE